jgi:hypothetical protein
MGQGVSPNGGRLLGGYRYWICVQKVFTAEL